MSTTTRAPVGRTTTAPTSTPPDTETRAGASTGRTPDDQGTAAAPSYAWVDTLAVLVLSMVGLSGLATSFEDRQWVFVAAVALGLGLGWALLGHAVRARLDLVLATLPLPFFLSAGVVALGSSGLFYGFPDGETLGRVMTGTFTGWRQLVETAPPIESQGMVMLLPYLLGTILPGTALAVSLRSRRAVLPLLPLVVLLVATLVLGFQEPFSVALQGVGFALVALLWVGHRAGRIEAGRDDVGAAAARVSVGRVAAGAVVLCLVGGVVTVTVDDDSSQRWVLREAVQPYATEQLATPLATFRRFRKGPANSLADDLLFTVQGAPEGARVRLAVLDNYDGTRWYADPDRSSSDHRDRFLRVSRRIDDPGPGSEHYLTVRAQRTWDLDWLPVVGRVREFRFHDDVEHRRRDQVRYNRSTGTALVTGGLGVDETYSLDVRVPQERLTEQMAPWPEPDADLAAQAAFLDVAVAAWGSQARTPMRALFAMAAQLRKRGRYSDGAVGWEKEEIPSGHDAQRLGNEFVNATRQIGNDEQYAATMALLANRLGIPARVAVGARIPESGKVFGRDIGAWVEVRIANGTWRVLPNTAFMSRRPPSRSQEALRPIQAPEEVEQPQPQRPDRDSQADQDQAEEDDPQGPLGVVERGSRWWVWVLLGVVLLSAAPLAKAVRRVRRRTATPTPLRFAGAWDEMLDAARDLGLPVVGGVRARQGAALGVPVELARAADRGAFARDDLSAEEADDFWFDVEDAVDEMRSRARWWRRLSSTLNPASLLRRRR